MTTETDLLPLPPLRIAPSVEPVDYPSVAQALMDYAHANVAHAVAPLQAEIETLLAELDIRDSIIATHAADTREYKKRISQAEARADKLAEALKEIRSRSAVNLAMNPNPYELTALLGDIHQIAGAALAQEADRE